MQFQSERTFKWLLSQDISNVKQISRVIQAAYLWDVKTDLVSKLIDLKKGACWENSLRDTARAASALAPGGTVFSDVIAWMLSEQKDMAWNNDVYDTAYVLASLADMGVWNREGCLWLIDNYGASWEHPGTTALIINALKKQDEICEDESNDLEKFIDERAEWILSERTAEGAWKTPATSNIVMQALINTGYCSELGESVQWLLDRMNDNGSWGKNEGDINTTALSLITLASLEKAGLP
ncbi:hypothetical protein HWN40_11045 [Methanolobus zinderi]|uniref:Terpene cyclase/mutase family protein n=1 Tax=Methanolobus zinderi TaxID=536044 RepID=A0A7D5I578_9EURY|nr:hypothetical protein [Methanolobus zinderi]KXS44642.1 MAG: hypothetical protein AWU59_348 [Methanolobus sp. T82-4]QLC50728.1 hypothetical protein HWN40_11045 [Methanolobus zinderi]